MNRLIIRIIVVLGILGLFFPFIIIKMPLGFPFEVRGIDIGKKIIRRIVRDEKRTDLIDKIRSHITLSEWSDVVKKIKKSIPEPISKKNQSKKSFVKRGLTQVSLWQVLFVPIFYFVALFFLILAFFTTDRVSLFIVAGISIYAIVVVMSANMCLGSFLVTKGLFKETIGAMGRIHLYPGFAFGLMALAGFVGGLWRVFTGGRVKKAAVQ